MRNVVSSTVHLPQIIVVTCPGELTPGVPPVLLALEREYSGLSPQHKANGRAFRGSSGDHIPFDIVDCHGEARTYSFSVDPGAKRDIDPVLAVPSFALGFPAARVALSTARGDLVKGYQDIAFPRYTRYVEDAADMARIIRGEKPTDFSYDHDLTVQTAVLQASGLASEPNAE